MISISIVHHAIWSRIEPYLHIVEHGAADDPQVRIEFLDVPDLLSQAMMFTEMACVACQRPIHPLRRRKGDDLNRIYYSPTCALTTNMACSRSRAAALEYQRFLGITRDVPQLMLFG